MKYFEKNIILILAVLLLLSFSMTSISVYDSLNVRESSNRLGVANSLADKISSVAGVQALERGLGTAILLNMQDNKAALEQYQKYNKDAEQQATGGMELAERLYSMTENPTLRIQIDQWRSSLNDVRAYRSKILDGSGDASIWFNLTTNNIHNEFMVRSTAFEPETEKESIILLNSLLRAYTATLAELAGRERSIIAGVIANQQPISESDLNILKSYRSIVEIMSDSILEEGSRLSTHAKVKAAIALYKDNFLGSYQRLREDIYQHSTDFLMLKNNFKSSLLKHSERYHAIMTHEFRNGHTLSASLNLIRLAQALSSNDQKAVQQWQPRVLKEFENSFIRNQYLQQLRFLDSNGREIVRLNKKQGKLVEVKRSDLQDKSGGDYFLKAMQLKAGNYYLSDLNLNREQGKLERPLQPVMQLAMPVYVDGKAAAVVVLNNNPIVLYQQSYQGLTRFGETFLINKQGYYLQNSETEKQWGFVEELGRENLNIQVDFPSSEQALLNSVRGELLTENNRSLLWQKVHVDPLDLDNYWITLGFMEKTKYPLNESEWIARATEGINSVLFISEAVGIISAEASEKFINTALRSIVLNVLSVFLMLMAFISIIFLLQISQIKERDMKLAKEEADRANKAKTLFLSSMSHELRTPLNTIIGYSQILEMDDMHALTSDQKESVAIIGKSGNHLLKLIDEVLELSKIEAGKVSISMENINLSSIVSILLSSVRTMAAEHQVSLIEYNPSTRPSFVMADKTRLLQVLINLTSNAIKYNKPGGEVSIRWQLQSESIVRISIENTGAGIAAERMDDLFKPFDRLGAEMSNTEGTGIGLSITKQLVELMQGTILVDSSPGEITSFHVDLKAGCNIVSKIEIAHEVPANSLDNGSENKYTVLYVEDNSVNLQLMEKILKTRPDIQLISAVNAEDGLAMASEIAERLDLILMDINLPGMSGLQAVRHLKQMSETKHIPVVAVSANAMRDDEQAGMQAGFESYITKPLNINTFLKVIYKILKQ